MALNVSVPRDLWRQVRVLAAQQDRTAKSLLAEALKAYVDEHTPDVQSAAAER